MRDLTRARRTNCRHVVAVAAAVLLSASSASGAETTDTEAFNWANPNEVTVDTGEMCFTSTQFAAAKNEGLYVWAYCPDGSLVLYCLFHIESRVLDRWGAYLLTVDPKGNVHWATTSLDPESVSHSNTRLLVTDGTTLFRGAGGAYDLVTTVGDISCDLNLESRLSPWKPGTGTIDYTPDGSLFQTRILVSPYAEVTGTVTAGGNTFEIEGHGGVEKTRFANPLTRFAPYLHYLRLYRDDEYFFLLDITLNEVYGGRSVPALGFARSDDWLFTSREYTFDIARWTPAEEVPYDYPTEIAVECESSGYCLSGVYRETRRLSVTDVFGELPFFARGFLGFVFSRPIYVRSAGTFIGSLTEPGGRITPVELSGFYEYAVVR